MIERGVHQNEFFIYLGWSKCSVCISKVVCYSLGLVLIITYVILIYLQMQ